MAGRTEMKPRKPQPKAKQSDKAAPPPKAPPANVTTLDDAGKAKVFQANLANVLRKVKSGRTLSKLEMELIERAAGPATKATTPKGGISLEQLKPALLARLNAQALLDNLTTGNRPLKPAEFEFLLRQLQAKQEPSAANNAAQPLPTIAKTAVEMAGLLGVVRQTFCEWRNRFPEDAPKPSVSGCWNVAEVFSWCRRHDLRPDAADLVDGSRQLIEERLRIDNATRRLNLDAKQKSVFTKAETATLILSAVAACKNELLRLRSRAKDLEGLPAAEIDKRLGAWITEALSVLYRGPSKEFAAAVDAAADAIVAQFSKNGNGNGNDTEPPAIAAADATPPPEPEHAAPANTADALTP